MQTIVFYSHNFSYNLKHANPDPQHCGNQDTEMQCSESVTFWYGSGSADLYLSLRIRIRFLSSVTLRMQKIVFSPIVFLITYPQAHYLQSLIDCFTDKFCVKFYFVSIISVCLYKKREGSGSVHLTDGSG
jgi:hypothetical protein